MARRRNARSASFKAKVAFEAIRERKTVSEIAQQHSVHPTQIHQWKKYLLENGEELFEDGRTKRKKDDSQESVSELYEQIGRLKMELEWLKKNLPRSTDLRRQLVGRYESGISIRRQCELVGLPRSTYYYEPLPESEENLTLMRRIDEEYLRRPFFGTRQMTAWLRRSGHKINRKRVQRLMRLMGLEAIFPRKNTSKPGEGHKVYPYLLRGVEVTHPDQVWCTDITYIGLRHGFMYLVVIMDWYSRHVLSWRLSNTLGVEF
jgi:putative transposase